MTYREILREGEAALKAAGVNESRLDAWYLFSHCFSMERAAYFLKSEEAIVGQEAKVRFRYLIEKRKQRIPLQQILENQEFMGLSFFVNEHVLIPRQDTETLVESVLAGEKTEQVQRILEGQKNQTAVRRPYRILDLCTGSGCIGLSLAHYLGGEPEILLSDISAKALRVAEENIRRLGMEGTCCTVKSDLFGSLAGERFDCIVSNPPYIPRDEIEKLSPEVKDHEPRLALDGTEDGLAFYRKISAEAAEYLIPGGRLYLEIGWNQGKEVAELLEKAGFLFTEVVRDLAGNDRVVKAVRPK